MTKASSVPTEILRPLSGYLKLFSEDELTAACRRAGVERGGGRLAMISRLLGAAAQGRWSTRRLLRKFDADAIRRCCERHYPQRVSDGEDPLTALAAAFDGPSTWMEQATGRVMRGSPHGKLRLPSFPSETPRPPSVALTDPPFEPRRPSPPRPARQPRGEVARAKLAEVMRAASWGVEELSSDLMEFPSRQGRVDRLAELRGLQLAREGAPTYAAVLKVPSFPTRDALRSALSQAIAEASAFSRALDGTRPLGIVAVDALSDKLRYDAGEYLAVVHPDCAFGFIDPQGRTELVGEGLTAEGGSIASRVRPGSDNYSEDLAPLLRFGAGQLMLRQLLAQAERPEAAPFASATDLMRATGRGITVPTAAHFVNSLSAKGFLLPGRVALDPARVRELLVEARDAQARVEVVTPGYGAVKGGMLSVLAQAARGAGLRVVLAGQAAAADLGLRALGPREPLLAYVASKDLSPLRAAIKAVLRDRGQQLVRASVEAAELVLVVPPSRTAIFDAAEASRMARPLFVADELQLWLDGRPGWAEPDEADTDAARLSAGWHFAGEARRAAARTVEGRHPLWDASRGKFK